MTQPLFGVGFRSQHFEDVLRTRRTVDWFEILSDNYIGVGGPRRAMLDRLRADYPLVLHGVSLSIAGVDPLSDEYLDGLRALADWLEPAWVSDHLCWTALGGHQSHDLLPVAYTYDVLDHVAARVLHVQERLGRHLLLENPSAYVAFRNADMTEAEFLTALCHRTGCGILLDVNNLYVNAANLGVDPTAYLAHVPVGTIGYMHLAGHTVLPDVRIDTHDADVSDPVWDLFAAAVRRFPDAGVIIERDDNVPPFAHLVREVERARGEHAAAGAPATSPLKKTALMLREPQHERGSACARGVSVHPEALEGGAETPVQRAARRAATPPLHGRAAVASAVTASCPWTATQRDFWMRLVEPVAVDGDAGDDGLARVLDDGRPVSAARGMRVYRDAYGATLRRALAVNFPTLARVLRADDFDRLVAAYVRRHPPEGHDVRRLGAALSGFLHSYTFAADYDVEPAAFADLAALEQAQLEVSAALDEDAAVTPASLATIAPADWEGVRFAFVPALRIVQTTHDVLPAVEASGRGEPPPRPMRAPNTYLVYRTNGTVHTERLSQPDATVLEALVAGHTFGAACARVENGLEPAHVAGAAARALVAAAARGVVARVRRPDVAIAPET